MAGAYYNEFDPQAAAWLRELIKAGHIADGEVDERSILDVAPSDIAGFTQCHFFAGIGVWSYALRLAGWDDSRPVWTGSCPCQPFSTAGKGAGFSDERHLWPAFFHLIEQRRPAVVFGEQVASRDALDWLDLVRADLEGSDYAFGAADLCAAGFGAPHIRQRLYWVADSGTSGLSVRERAAVLGAGRREEGRAAEQRGGASAGGLADTGAQRCGGCGRSGIVCSGRTWGEHGHCSEARGLADADGRQCCDRDAQRSGQLGLHPQDGGAGRQGDRGPWASARPDVGPGPTNGYWRDADWLLCRDGRWRPVEPGAFPLVDGAPARVGRLRGYGNGLVAQVAAAFVRASM